MAETKEYKTYKIGELGKVVTGRTPPSSKPECFGSNFPFITPSDMKEERTVKTERFLSEEGALLLKNNMVPSGSVAVSCIGSQMGKSVLVKTTSFTNQQLNTVIPNENVNSDYLYYLMLTKRELLFSLGSASGVATPILNKGAFSEIEVALPSTEIQENIASILRSYDDLIENNNRRIQILETIAQKLYQEWFIHYRFPGHQQTQWQETDQGKIPVGWEIKKIEDCYQTSSGGTPSRKKPEYYGEDHNWIKTKELRDSFVLDTEEKISDLGLAKSSAKLFPKHTTIIAMYGATIGRLGITTTETATNQACCAFLPLNEAYSPWFIYLSLKEKKLELLALGQGAAQQNISQQVIKGFELLVPETILLTEFNKIVEPLFLQMENLVKKNKNLKKQRGLLLSKLITG